MPSITTVCIVVIYGISTRSSLFYPVSVRAFQVTMVLPARRSDVVTFESRALRFVLLHALIVGSASVSSLGLGFFIDAVGFAVPFIVMTWLLTLHIFGYLCQNPERKSSAAAALLTFWTF